MPPDNILTLHNLRFIGGLLIIASLTGCDGQVNQSISAGLDIKPANQFPGMSFPSFDEGETRRLILDYPLRLRSGDSDVIQLTLETEDSLNSSPSEEIPGFDMKPDENLFPVLNEPYRVSAEARLDLAGIEIRPADLIIEPMLPGQSVTFYWNIQPREAGAFRGTIWLHFRFVNEATGEELLKPVSAQIFEIQVRKFLGLSAGWPRAIGWIGFVSGCILSYPFFAQVVNYFTRRLSI